MTSCALSGLRGFRDTRKLLPRACCGTSCTCAPLFCGCNSACEGLLAPGVLGPALLPAAPPALAHGEAPAPTVVTQAPAVHVSTAPVAHGLQCFPPNSVNNTATDATQASITAVAKRLQQNVSVAPRGKGFSAWAPAPGSVDALAGSCGFGVQPCNPQKAAVCLSVAISSSNESGLKEAHELHRHTYRTLRQRQSVAGDVMQVSSPSCPRRHRGQWRQIAAWLGREQVARRPWHQRLQGSVVNQARRRAQHDRRVRRSVVAGDACPHLCSRAANRHPQLWV